MAMTAAGKNGSVTFDGRTVQIEKKRLFGGGTHQFPVGSINAVNFKAGTMLTVGYVQFVISGQTAHTPPRLTDNAGMREFQRESNVVTFGGRQTPEFQAICDAVRAASQSTGAAPTSPPASGGHGVADELRKLAELRDAGILSAAEFDAEKQRLLSQ